jgi:PAS domain S-box-containing protein
MQPRRPTQLQRLLIEILLIVGLVELLVMLVIGQLAPQLPASTLPWLDAAVLALLAAPLIYWRLARSHQAEPDRTLRFETLPRRLAVSSPWLWTSVAIAIGVGLSLLLAYSAQQRITLLADERFAQQVKLVSQDVAYRFDQPLMGLRGLAGLFQASRLVDRQEFRRYWETRDVEREFPGVRGFGMIEEVPRAQLGDLVTMERRSGAPDFRITTLGTSATPYIIRYVEPIERNRQAVGLDVGSEPVRKAAVERAFALRQPVLSGVISLVQDGRRGPGFLYLMPLPTADGTPRRLVYSPIVLGEILAGTASLTGDQVEFDIYDGNSATPERLLYTSARPSTGAPDAAAGQASGNPPRYRATFPLVIGTQAMTLRVRSTPGFDSSVDSDRPLLLGVGGSLFTLLLAAALWLLARGRALAEQRAREMSSGLTRLARVAESTTNSVVIANERYEIEWVNDAFVRISGIPREQAIGRRASQLRSSKEVDGDVLTRIHASLERGESLRLQTHNRGPDGREYWLDADLHAITDEAGRFAGYVAVETDITDEVRHKAQLQSALRDNQALMQTVNALAIVSETDVSGRITSVNDAFVRISGYARDELIGANHRLLNSGVMPPGFWTRMWDTISSGQPWRAAVCNRAKDGSLYWVDSMIAPFLDNEGLIERYVSIRFDITEARNNQLALARERQRLEGILEATNAGTLEANLQTGEMRIDERWATMLGYRLEELQPFNAEKWLPMAHPEDERQSRLILRELLAGKRDYYEMERRVRHKDGHWVWVLARSRIATRTPDGQVEWLVGTHLDISERHALFEQIEQSNRLMQVILDNLPCGLSVFDGDLRLVSHNPLYRKLLDFPDTLFSKYPPEFEDFIRFNAERGDYGPGHVDTLVAAIVERARHPTPHRLERTRPNGTTIEIIGAPMPEGGFVTTYTDITERKQAEAEAHHAETMLRASIDALEEAFVLYDPQDRLVMCNERYRQLYAHTAPIIEPGRTFEELIRYGAERGEYKAAIGRIDEWVAERLAQHLSGSADVIQELDNGRVLRIVERKTPDGYIVGFRIDVTDLARARQAAEAASQSKSQFLANMSHEIRTPMNAILGMLSLIQGTSLDAQQQDYIQKTEGAARSLLELLNDILDFSKIEAGKMSLDPHPFRLDHLLRELSVILAANTGKKNIEVLFDLDPHLPTRLVGDSLRLKQVLINLGGNAIKFTEHGEVVVRIRVVGRQDAHPVLRFEVRDTGIGIAPENVRRIFEGFSQAEASTTRRFGGTGLGLAISARLVALMGGRLEVDSELGRGSNFHFTVSMPLDTVTLDRDDVADARPARPLNVLVIDDNPVALETLRAQVESMGWQVELASGGEQALATIESRKAAGLPPYEAIFVDWQMPGMDGWQASQKIRAAMAGGQAPILVMVTAHGREMLARQPQAMQTLVDGYLVKPVTPSMLLDAVMSALHPQEGRHRRVAPAQATRRLAGLRVLVVEDNPINQQVARELLQREGAQVTLADNGALGVQAVLEASPLFDVVLMDVQMPVMDGYTATRALRERAELASLPIIAMTANAMATDREDCLAAGMNDHVGKPFQIDALVATLLRHTGHVPPPAGDAVQAVAQPMDVPGHVGALDPDLQQALDRLGGDEGLFLRVIQTFTQGLPDLPDQLAAALQSGRRQDAVRLLHTLKGTAGTIGATALATLAAGIESGLKEQDAIDPEHIVHALRDAIDSTLETLAPVPDALKRRLGAEAVPAVESRPDLSGWNGKLMELRGLLANSDLAALDMLDSLRSGWQPSDNRVRDLDDAVNKLDFAHAQRICDDLINHPPTDHA